MLKMIPNNIEKGTFIIAVIIFEFGPNKETKKYYSYVEQVEKMNVGRLKNQIEVYFLRCIRTIQQEDVTMVEFSFPHIRDIMKIDAGHEIEVLEKPLEMRERFFLNVQTTKCTAFLN